MEDKKIRTLEEQINIVIDEYILILGQIKSKDTRKELATRFLEIVYETSNIVAISKVSRDVFVERGLKSILDYLDANDKDYRNIILGKRNNG